MNVAKPGDSLGPAAPDDGWPDAGGTRPAESARRFADVLAGPAEPPAKQPFQAPILDAGPPELALARPGRVNGLAPAQRVPGPVRTLEVSGELGWQKLADDTFRSELRIDSLLKAAQGGKAFNAAELMALQVEVFRYSQTVEVISRTTDKLVGAIKQTLGTQV
jgi:hypothetical protein